MSCPIQLTNPLKRCEDEAQFKETITIGMRTSPDAYKFNVVSSPSRYSYDCVHERDFKCVDCKHDGQTGESCEDKSFSLDQCKPKVGFGMASVSGIRKIGDTQQQVVQFKTNCYYKKYDKPQRMYYRTTANNIPDRQGLGLEGDTLENCYPDGCKQDDNERGKRPGSVILTKEENLPADAITPFSRNIWLGNESMVDFMPFDLKLTYRNRHHAVFIPDPVKTCIDLGNKKVLNMNLTSCPINRVAECTYAADTIAGGCADGECVRRGFNTFMSEVNGMMGPQSSTLDDRGKAARNLGLARLVEGLTEKGKCGEPNATCLQKLNLSCAFIAQAASEIQPQSQILYESLVRAQQVCNKGL